MSVIDPASPPLDELAEINASFENAHPGEVVAWAHERFGNDMVFTCSFEDPVLVHLVATKAPGCSIALLDTGFLFAQTHWYAHELQRLLGFPLDIVYPLENTTIDFRESLEGCCGARKVEPLNRVLAGKGAWITGVRRVDAPTRANAPIVSWDPVRNLVKLNPIATLSDDDLELYQSLYELPANPLVELNYASIGCWPCTRPVAPGEDRRAGRWAGSGKVECGLHVTPAGPAA
ncbi:MAG: phosphoadenylyl-sulfate reductase [Acidimicrobiia bacterium]